MSTSKSIQYYQDKLEAYKALLAEYDELKTLHDFRKKQLDYELKIVADKVNAARVALGRKPMPKFK